MDPSSRLAALSLGAILCAVLLLGCGGGGSDGGRDHREVELTVPGLGVLQGGLAPGSLFVAEFNGIPFAKPPTGSRRWQPPEPHGPWDSPRDATAFGAACIQRPTYSPNLITDQSEDCLFLNVATPVWAVQAAGNSSFRLRVMLWIHGGGYNAGAGQEYNASALVAASNRDLSSAVVVVTVNYRLNVFGYLASGDVQSESTDNSAGNFGQQDQHLAMLWVKDHIAAFGGSSQDVTIFGESAGGNAIMNHLVQPLSYPLFTRAIIQSGAYSEGARSMEAAEADYQGLLTETGCGNLLCLREMDAETIFAKGSSIRTPVVDGVWLKATPAALIAEGNYHKVPVLLGANRDEYAYTMSSYSPNMTEEDVDSGLSAIWGASNYAIAKALYDPSVYTYPAELGAYSQWYWMFMRMHTDRVPGLGHCGHRWLGRLLLETGAPAVYVYSFDHPLQKVDPWNTVGTGPGSLFAVHGCEIPFVFGDPSELTPGEEAQLGADMSKYWVAFARTAAPEVEGLPTWPRYEAESDIIMAFDVGAGGGIRTKQYFRDMACDFWEASNFTSMALAEASDLDLEHQLKVECPNCHVFV